jgi:probable F420-dependent oxidoreductase
MDLGSVGVWSRELRYGDAGAVAEAAAELEELGYSALWFPAGGEGAFETASTLLGATRRVVVATGILSVWWHDAEATAAAHAEVGRAHPGRFLLGLGISHGPLVERFAPGRRYEHLMDVTTSYLDALDAAPKPVPVAERALAALGPRMLALARDRTAGAHPYLVPPEHTRRAREVLGDGPLLAPEQAVALETDPTRAREIGREHLERYLMLPNYVNNWRRLGFTDDDFSGGGSDRLVDGLVAWGDPATIVDRLRAHREAGADHVCIQVVGTPSDSLPLSQWRQIAEVLATGGI